MVLFLWKKKDLGMLSPQSKRAKRPRLKDLPIRPSQQPNFDPSLAEQTQSPSGGQTGGPSRSRSRSRSRAPEPRASGALESSSSTALAIGSSTTPGAPSSSTAPAAPSSSTAPLPRSPAGPQIQVPRILVTLPSEEDEPSSGQAASASQSTRRSNTFRHSVSYSNTYSNIRGAKGFRKRTMEHSGLGNPSHVSTIREGEVLSCNDTAAPHDAALSELAPLERTKSRRPDDPPNTPADRTPSDERTQSRGPNEPSNASADQASSDHPPLHKTASHSKAKVLHHPADQAPAPPSVTGPPQLVGDFKIMLADQAKVHPSKRRAKTVKEWHDSIDDKTIDEFWATNGDREAAPPTSRAQNKLPQAESSKAALVSSQTPGKQPMQDLLGITESTTTVPGHPAYRRVPAPSFPTQHMHTLRVITKRAKRRTFNGHRILKVYLVCPHTNTKIYHLTFNKKPQETIEVRRGHKSRPVVGMVWVYRDEVGLPWISTLRFGEYEGIVNIDMRESTIFKSKKPRVVEHSVQLPAPSLTTWWGNETIDQYMWAEGKILYLPGEGKAKALELLGTGDKNNEVYMRYVKIRKPGRYWKTSKKELECVVDARQKLVDQWVVSWAAVAFR